MGDIDPATARKFADLYFAPLPKGPLPPRPTTAEPAQDGPKLAQVESGAQPIEFIGYKRASQYDKNDPIYDVISSILSSGRTGLLYKSLVRDNRVALAAGAESAFPGSKYPNLFVLYLMPSMGKSLAENEKDLNAVLDQLRNQKVDDGTLQRVKTRERAALIRQLDSNSGLASLLATYYANFGDWRKLFTQLDEYDKITPDDVQRVARELFTDRNKTVAFLKPPAAPPQPAPPGETR